VHDPQVPTLPLRSALQVAKSNTRPACDGKTQAKCPYGLPLPRSECGAGLAAAAIELGLVDELRMFRYPVVVGGGTPFLPPVTEDVPLDLIETRTFGSRVIYERYGRARDESD
jgi:hypothetical protein